MKLYALMLTAALAAAPVHATLLRFQANLDGPSEAPANASPGTGLAIVDWDTVAHTMKVNATFQGLLGTTTTSHIHCCTAVAGTGTAGVTTATPTFPGFPSGVSSGTYDNVFDMTLNSSYNPAFIGANGGTPTSAEAALLAGLGAGKAYFNIHSSQFGGGEIRGFLSQVPEPGTAALLALALGALWRQRRESRESNATRVSVTRSSGRGS